MGTVAAASVDGPSRPDGLMAWVGEGAETGLADALTMWFGPPAA